MSSISCSISYESTVSAFEPRSSSDSLSERVFRSRGLIPLQLLYTLQFSHFVAATRRGCSFLAIFLVTQYKSLSSPSRLSLYAALRSRLSPLAIYQMDEYQIEYQKRVIGANPYTWPVVRSVEIGANIGWPSGGDPYCALLFACEW